MALEGALKRTPACHRCSTACNTSWCKCREARRCCSKLLTPAFSSEHKQKLDVKPMLLMNDCSCATQAHIAQSVTPWVDSRVTGKPRQREFGLLACVLDYVKQTSNFDAVPADTRRRFRRSRMMPRCGFGLGRRGGCGILVHERIWNRTLKQPSRTIVQ